MADVTPSYIKKRKLEDKNNTCDKKQERKHVSVRQTLNNDLDTFRVDLNLGFNATCMTLNQAYFSSTAAFGNDNNATLFSTLNTDPLIELVPNLNQAQHIKQKVLVPPQSSVTFYTYRGNSLVKLVGTVILHLTFTNDLD